MARVVVVLIGLPGAGKSTLARGLPFDVVDRDGLPAKRISKGAGNAAVWRHVAAVLRRRRSVVIDGMTFAARRQRARAQQLARRHGARYVELFLDCPVPLAKQRVASGAHRAPDRKPALVDEVARRFDRVSRLARRLDARQPAAVLLRQALRAIG